MTADTLDFTELQVPSVLAALFDISCGPDPASIGKAMHQGFGELMAFIAAHDLHMNKQPRAIYTAYGAQGVSCTLVAPLAAPPKFDEFDGPVRIETLQATKAWRFTHRGPYSELANTYNQITGYLMSKGLLKSESDWAQYMPMWEEYANDPGTTEPENLITYIYLPVK